MEELQNNYVLGEQCWPQDYSNGCWIGGCTYYGKEWKVEYCGMTKVDFSSMIDKHERHNDLFNDEFFAAQGLCIQIKVTIT